MNAHHRSETIDILKIVAVIMVLVIFFSTKSDTIFAAIDSGSFALLWFSAGFLFGLAVTLVYLWSGGKLGNPTLPANHRRVLYALVVICVSIGSSVFLAGTIGTIVLLGASVVWAFFIILQAVSSLGYISIDL